MSGHEWWYVSRAAGILALAAMTASVLIGLSLGGRMSGRSLLAFRRLHEQLSLTALLALGLHGEALIGDRWLRPGVLGVTVPFVMDYRPLATGAGIVAGYLALALGLSFYLRKRIGIHRWRTLHRFTAVAWGLAVVHALTAGTDADQVWLRLPTLASAAAVVALLAVRWSGASRTPRAARPASVRR